MHNRDSTSFAATLRASGLRDVDLAPVLGVSQSMVSRLKNGRIKRVSPYVAAWDRHTAGGAALFSERMRDLEQRAMADEQLRTLLINLHTVVQTA